MSSRRAAPTHLFRHPVSHIKKLHANNAVKFVEAVGGQVVQYDDGRYHIVVLAHQPEPVAKWLSRQTPDVDWISEDLTEENNDEQENAYLYE